MTDDRGRDGRDDRDDEDDDDEMPELPPAFQKFQDDLKKDRKTLLREKAYGQSPDQLRAFIAQFLFPRLDEFVELMGLALYDTYGLSVSNTNQLQRMRAVYSKALKALGAKVPDEDDELPGVSPEVLDEFQQAFYALGPLLKKKLPDDKETEEAYNRCVGLIAKMVGELMGDGARATDDDKPSADDDGDPERVG